MEIKSATEVFASLSQETRLHAFRELVQAGSSGLSAGALSQVLQVPANTLSFHLSHLLKAQIVTVERQGRSLIYRANYPVMQETISFLIRNCCGQEFVDMKQDQNTGRAIIEMRGCCKPTC